MYGPSCLYIHWDLVQYLEIVVVSHFDLHLIGELFPEICCVHMESAELQTFELKIFEKKPFSGCQPKKQPFQFGISETKIRFFGCQLENAALK